MAGIPAWVKPYLPAIVGAAAGLTFITIVNLIGVLGLVIIWLVIVVIVSVFYAFGWRQEAASLRKPRLRTDGEFLKVAPDLSAPKVSAPKQTDTTVPTAKTARVPLKESQICAPGPHDVEPRGFTRIELNVAPGMKVTGRLEETYSQPFDWAILHETELVKFRQRRRAKVGLSGHDEPAYAVEWIVPAKGPWFLVLDGYGKKTRREVGV